MNRIISPETSTVSKPRQRFGFLDAIRGVAACAVMLQHSLYQSGLLGDYAHHAVLTGFVPKYLELGETGVVAFFLVSGFVIPLSLERTNDFWMFWLHRILRIYPLYITIYVVTFALEQGGGLHGIKALLINLATSLLLIQEYAHQHNFVGVSWTLSLEMIWYICISLLFLRSLNTRITLVVCGAAVISLLGDAGCVAQLHVPMGRVSMLDLCVTGLLCYRFSRQDISPKHFCGLLAAMGTLILFNLLIGLKLFPSPHPTAGFHMAVDSWALGAAIFLLPWATQHAPLWDFAAFRFLGRISYSIYLVHPVILEVFGHFGLTGPVLILATFAITILLATLTYRWIEAPAIDFGHSFARR